MPWPGYRDPDARIFREGVAELPLVMAADPHPDQLDPTDPTVHPDRPVRPVRLLQATFPEAVEAARLAWNRQDARAIVAGSRELLLQLPGSDRGASVSRDQAARLVEAVLQRAEEVAVRLVTSREVGAGEGYAELLREYRVAGTEEARAQRVLLAFRRDPQRGRWELVELRVLHGGQ